MKRAWVFFWGAMIIPAVSMHGQNNRSALCAVPITRPANPPTLFADIQAIAFATITTPDYSCLLRNDGFFYQSTNLTQYAKEYDALYAFVDPTGNVSTTTTLEIDSRLPLSTSVTYTTSSLATYQQWLTAVATALPCNYDNIQVSTSGDLFQPSCPNTYPVVYMTIGPAYTREANGTLSLQSPLQWQINFFCTHPGAKVTIPKPFSGRSHNVPEKAEGPSQHH
jgi:hypothetical protein